MSLIQEYLKYSPLGVSVTAWQEKNGVYVDNGQRNTHWTVCYGWNDKGLLIYDSYEPHRKILSFDHRIEVAKRYQLIPSTRKQQIGFMEKIIQLLLQVIGLVDKPTSPVIVPPVPVLTQPAPIPSPTIEPKPSVGQFAEAIKTYEGWQPPSAKYPNGTTSWRNKNAGNIKGKDGKFLVFSTEAKGFQYLCDYIRRVARNEHEAYPKDCSVKQFFLVYAPVNDKNFPIQYGVWIAHRLEITPDFLVKSLV